MKRVVAIVIVMAVVTSLFAFSVYAAPAIGTTYTATISSDDNNITAYAYAVYEEGVYQLSSQGTEITSPSLLLSFRIVNNTDKWVIKNDDQFKFRVNGITAVSYPIEFIDLENCTIAAAGTASGRIDLTIKGDNSFILAPNETYVMSFRLVVYEGFSTPTLQFFNNQFVNTDYTIDELVSLPADELAYLSSLNVNIQNLIDVLSYSGNLNGIIPDNISNLSFNTYNLGSNFEIRGSRVISKPVVETVVYYTDSSSDQTIFVENCYYDVDYYFRYSNSNRKSIKLDRYSNAYNFELLGNELTYQSDLIEFESNLFESYQIYFSSGVRFLECYPSLSGDDRYVVIPVGRNMVHYKVRYHWIRTDSSTLPTLPVFNVNQIIRNISDYTVSVVDDYFPRNIYNVLRDLYISLTKPSSEDNTEEAQDMNDDIHDAEQVWYDNNSEALEEVGLSNYRFNPSQSNGITQAVTQFQAVWNALGDWTNVYIFILILSISTYIIRHEPTTRVKQYRSSVSAERAERISYYGHKNAESRAASSSGSTMKNAIRRRK